MKYNTIYAFGGNNESSVRSRQVLVWRGLISIILIVIISEPNNYYGIDRIPVCTGSGMYRLHCIWYSGSQSHTTRRGRALCSLWYARVANVCDLLLFLDENRVIPEFRHFWKVTSPDEQLFTVLYFPSDAFPMTWPRKLISGLNNTGMKVTWLRTMAYTRP